MTHPYLSDRFGEPDATEAKEVPTDCAATDPALSGPYDLANGQDVDGNPVNAFGRTEAMNTPAALAAEAERSRP